MDFPDEVDTPFKEARQRFQKYRGVKSLKNCDWDPYENLPPEYSKIWRFQSYQAAYKDSVQQVIEEGLPINGTFISIVLELDQDQHTMFHLNQAVILSTLFPHECKLSTMHFKINRSFENKDIVPSKTSMEFHCGFRRLKVKPIFCAETNPSSATEKYKYMRFLRDDMSAVATVYAPIVFSPCKVLCFTEESLKH